MAGNRISAVALKIRAWILGNLVYWKNKSKYKSCYNKF